MRKIWLAVIALVGLQGSGANATTVDFFTSYSCPTCLIPSGNGELITTQESAGVYLITSFVGTDGGFPVTVAPVGTIFANDNLLYFPPTPAFYDNRGLGLIVDGHATDSFCLGVSCAVAYPDPNGYFHPSTIEVSQTPLPAALPLFATGLAVTGLLGWRKKRKAAAVIAAA